ncbi:MAG: methyltransferase domain-containing protein [Alphaproteobacteria bacterium]|nr:methyltransferase domain-containing protein [Alphaproteobacteria bacterium]
MSSTSGTLPPTFDRADGHAVFPETDHDETARLNFLTGLNVHIGKELSPGVRTAYEQRVHPAFEKSQGNSPETATDIRKAMLHDPYYQQWAALRRSTQEASQQVSREVALRRVDDLNAQAATLNEGRNTLSLDPDLKIPSYQAAVDNHLMPGSYYTEAAPDDVTAAATYEVSLFPIGGASFGAKGDGGGRAMANFVRDRFPDLNPKRIVDMGGGIGGNTLPLAAAFPDAEIIVVDTAAPMLRYGHARAQSMGYGNVSFVQGLAETVDLEPGSIDLIVSVMFWHETSTKTVGEGLAHMHSLLAPGGVMVHLEQPNFDADTPTFERFMRDWDAYYNNEPFWPKLHTLDMFKAMEDAGFKKDDLFDAGTEADIEPGRFQPWSTIVTRHRHETKDLGDTGRELSALGGYKGERWWLFGAVR